MPRAAAACAFVLAVGVAGSGTAVALAAGPGTPGSGGRSCRAGSCSSARRRARSSTKAWLGCRGPRRPRRTSCQGAPGRPLPRPARSGALLATATRRQAARPAHPRDRHRGQVDHRHPSLRGRSARRERPNAADQLPRVGAAIVPSERVRAQFLSRGVGRPSTSSRKRRPGHALTGIAGVATAPVCRSMRPIDSPPAAE